MARLLVETFGVVCHVRRERDTRLRSRQARAACTISLAAPQVDRLQYALPGTASIPRNVVQHRPALAPSSATRPVSEGLVRVLPDGPQTQGSETMAESLPSTSVHKGVRNSATASLQAMWRRVLERMAEQVSAEDLSQVVARLRPLELTSTDFRLEAPNQLVLVCVTDNYLPQLREAVAAVMGSRQVALELPSRNQGELFPERQVHVRELRRRGVEPIRARGLQGGRQPARRPLQPTVHLRWRRPR
ncbi:MAG: hypothetical protein E6J79_18480 [Deltaproteobacteria bacterium]|nr:MAG: hypothetical protein E6J79_18480 [Deltaproteobacteria bacterium]